MSKLIPKPGASPTEQLGDMGGFKTGRYVDWEVRIEGEEYASKRTFKHNLGKTPTSWRIIRAKPDTDSMGNVTEPVDENWATAQEARLVFPADGVWVVRIS